MMSKGIFSETTLRQRSILSKWSVDVLLLQGEYQVSRHKKVPFVANQTTYTGKSVSKALILKSVNPQYDDRLFIDLWLQYEKNTS